MSTRCRVLICTDANSAENMDCLYLYHHCDGYPSGVGSELSEILSQCPLLWNPEKVQKFINEYDDDYRITEKGISWDDEYYYIIDCEKRTLSGYYKGITDSNKVFDLSMESSDELLIPSNLFSSDRKPDADKKEMTAKESWIADVAVKILASCPYPYMSLDGQNFIPAPEYSAKQAKQMADVIFG